jgi:hypothetical protein
MWKLLKRRNVRLVLILLLGLAASVAIICSRESPVTQANFDRIKEGMSDDEVTAIFGSAVPELTSTRNATLIARWKNGPSFIAVDFRYGVVTRKSGRILTTWQTLQWYAKKGAAKIGVKWD